MAQTMVDKYGRVRVKKVVADFYAKVLRSSRLAHYFDDADIGGLIAHQAAFLGAVMGGPSTHTPDEIAAVHSGLGVSAEDFRVMVDLLDTSLAKYSVEDADRAEVLHRYLGFEAEIVDDYSSDD